MAQAFIGTKVNPDQNPQNSGMMPQGSSELYKYNTSPNTRAVLSQKIRLLSPTYSRNNRDSITKHQLGMVNSFSYSGNSRNTEPVRGIGFGDQIAERVPGVQDPIDISFARTLFYLSNAMQSVGFASGVDGPVRTIKHTRWPFDMEEQIVFSDIADAETQNANQNVLATIDYSGQNTSEPTIESFKYQDKKHKAIITYFEACWLTGVEHSVDISTALIAESCSAQATDVHDGFTTYGEFLSTGNNPYLSQVASKRFPK